MKTSPWIFCALGLLSLGLLHAEPPLRICVTTPDLLSLAERLGGEHVQVFCFTRGPEDPHAVDIRPSQVRELNQANLLIQVGLGLEEAWMPDLLARARNDRIRPGQPGHLDLGEGVRPLEEEFSGLHEEGNPHYLLDAVEGLKAARLICDRFVLLRPELKEHFDALHEKFVRDWAEMFFGAQLAAQINLNELEQFENTAALDRTIQAHSRDAGPGDGVVGMLLPFRRQSIVGDHDLWPYFARRHGLEILGYLEPSPGVPPTTRHLGQVVKKIETERVRVILTAPYFDARHGRWVSRQTGARIVPMAHQAGGRPGTVDYLELIQFNARQVAEALREQTP
jgi:ABC-type Zn uptake system ZnuABC Zn-binding protein ZnuA